MPHIAMLLSNGFRPDPRVWKEAQSLTQVGFRVTIICWDRNAEYPEMETPAENIQLIRIQHVRSTYGIGARQLLKLPLFWLSALRILALIKPDIIHCHDFDTLPAGLVWGQWHRTPVVYDAHEYYADLVKPRLPGLLGRFLYSLIRQSERIGSRYSSAVVTVDETLAAIYRQLNRQVLVLGHYPPGFQANSANPIFTRPELILLYAGRISRDRGSLIYLDILRSLRKAGIPAHLKLAGVFTPSDEEQIFNIHASGVEDYISYLGWVPYQEMMSVYHSADIGLCILLPEPRYIAALPVKLFEYMSAGLAVIASNFPMIEQILTRSKCGILVDPASPPETISKIIESWWHEPSTAQDFGENGRRAIQMEFNWENQIQAFTENYLNCTKELPQQ